MLFPAISMASTPQSPDKLPSSSWPSLPTGDWWSPPKQADLATPICPSGRHRPESGLRPRRRSWPHSLGPPLGFGCTGARKLSALHPWLSGGVFGSLQHEAQPVEVVQATAPTQPQIKAPLEKLPHYFPIPVGQFNSRLPRRILHRRLQLVLFTPAQDGGNPQSVQRPNLGPRLGESWPASFQWYEALSPKPQPLGSPTTLGPTTIAHANAPAHEVLVLHTCFPAGYLHPVATVRGVALCLSYPPPPPIDFFYRISQLLCRFVLCRFHLSFGLGGFPPQSRTQYPAIRGVRPTTRGVHGAPPARRNAPPVHVHGNPKYRKPWAVRISPRERRPAPAPSSGKSRLSPRNAARAKSHQACRQSQQLNVRPALAENGANAASPSRNPWNGGAIPKGLPLNQHG